MKEKNLEEIVLDVLLESYNNRNKDLSLKKIITIHVIKKGIDLSGRKYNRDKAITSEIEIAKELAKKYNVDYLRYTAGITGNEMHLYYQGTKENLEKLLKNEYNKRGKDLIYDYLAFDD